MISLADRAERCPEVPRIWCSGIVAHTGSCRWIEDNRRLQLSLRPRRALLVYAILLSFVARERLFARFWRSRVWLDKLFGGSLLEQTLREFTLVNSLKGFAGQTFLLAEPSSSTLAPSILVLVTVTRSGRTVRRRPWALSRVLVVPTSAFYHRCSVHS